MPTTPEECLAALRQWQARYTDAVRELRAQEFTGQSDGGLVEVVVDGMGELVDIALDDRAVEHLSDDALSQHLVAAVTAAREASRASVTTVAADRLGVDLSPRGIEGLRARVPTLVAMKERLSVSASATDPADLCTVRATAAGRLLEIWLSEEACALDGSDLAHVVGSAAGAAHQAATRAAGARMGASS